MGLYFVVQKEVVMMKGLTKNITKTAALFILLISMFLTGCAATQTGSTGEYGKDWIYVPSIHIEDNSFGVSASQDYYQCSYDLEYDGYWCLTHK
jgi:hypothetical protein